MAQRTAFVSGGTGFLGWHVIDQLLKDEWRVVALHREGSNISRLAELDAERVVAELTDPKALAKVIPNAPDAIFHVAGDTSLWAGHNDRQTRTNVLGTRAMVTAALAKNAGRFIYTSSVSAYGRRPGTLDEAGPSYAATSRINYERTKWLAEQEVRAGISAGLDAVILNPAGILGPGDTTGWARSYRLILEDKLPGVPPGGSSFCDVRDVAAAHVAAFTQGRCGENYLLGGRMVSFADILAEMAIIAGRPDLSLRLIPESVLNAYGYLSSALAVLTRREPALTREMALLTSDSEDVLCDKARRELGYKERPWQNSLRESFDWWRQFSSEI